MAAAAALVLIVLSSVAGEWRVAPGDDDRGLFPPTFNLAAGADIAANATCGEATPETFCKLVEHVRAPQCGICDARSSNESQRHLITNAIDGTTRWWQSASLQNGRQYERVTILLDLRQVYQVAYVIVKAANSPRPGNWVLERSLDGIHFKPWQYFAISDSECLEAYSIPPTIGIPRFRSDDEVICTSRYSRLEPLENGEIHVSLVKGRPGVSGPSVKLQEFTAARYVRLSLHKIRTLQGDLMILATQDWEKVHKSVTRRFGLQQLFYSIKDISIGGQCMCFGHAKDCSADPHTGRLKCRCVHNTCGDSCQRCCPLYNQKAWKVGTSDDAGICEKCQCNGHADECYYDKEVATRRQSVNVEGKFDGGGVCVNCKEHTTGINCERCVQGYYRPVGVLPDAPRPCLKCVCDGAGATGRCVGDAALLHRAQSPGDCICREGFDGFRCDRCAAGYRNYPVCDLCPCNAAGTSNTDCEGHCICKANVDGVRCDRCKPGFFNLDASNARGCTACYCFGVSNRCTSANLGVHVISTLRDWLVSDVGGTRTIRPFLEQGVLTVANDELSGHESYFWLSPSNFTGQKMHSYGGWLQFRVGWVHARGDSAGRLTKSPLLVMEGNGLRIAYGGNVSRTSGEVAVDVLLTEQGWHHVSLDGGALPDNDDITKGKAVERDDFVKVLLSLHRILIQAKFHTDQIVGKLLAVSMEVGSETMQSVKRMKVVEKCLCPGGYSGLSCESCEEGYRRVGAILHAGKCEKCDCHGHVTSCDAHTGVCQECLHHTRGERCEQCQDGFYGLATRGTANDCRPCACPLDDPVNNFSSLCDTVIDDESGDVDYRCTACRVGYAGDKCQGCADGFFGNPLVPADYCRPCECHGHLDADVANSCDRVTGQCLQCTGNTAGWHCQHCLQGYFGNATREECQPCKCNRFGSEPGTTCDETTGSCVCRRRYEGLACDRCIQHFGNVEADCQPCDCNTLGSESDVCSPLSGQCSCKPGVFGFKCDTCRDGYFNFSDAGCEWCRCHPTGAQDSVCHATSGQCSCKAHVTGRLCDTCGDGFWNLSSSGCDQCWCNETGSRSNLCHPDVGQCNCKEGVTGLHCDQCRGGFFGFSQQGCRVCDACSKDGHICHALSGECVCPALTEGPACEMCQKNAWRHTPFVGCEPCHCSADGSLDLQCDLRSGRCSCREGYEGARCDHCHFGYFSFPKCKSCKCDVDGTEPSKCRSNGLCECQENGQCPCKVNKEGKKCKHCKPGTFKMPAIHPKGCLECFCFGRSVQCSQARYTWTQLVLPNVTSASSEMTLSVVDGLRIVSGTADGHFELARHLSEPLYWSLPDTFRGDKVLSYMGNLYFTVQSSGGKRFPDAVLATYPLVRLQGNFRIALEYYEEVVAPDGRYKVQLQEDYWTVRNNPETVVTRKMMMVALQNVQHILIRASDFRASHFSHLLDVAMDVAVPAPHASPVVAVGVELCTCPPQYNGTSCQDPADGYFRKRKKDFLDSKDVLDLVGVAEPCACHNQSRRCDMESGFCQNCANNTAGPQCDVCAPGFYGDPLTRPCAPCACPSTNNSFSDTCELDVFGMLQCHRCRRGYSGNRCERCSDGYYGDPQLPGGRCKPCACDSRGSRHLVCDRFTGQCECTEGVAGQDCSQCIHRHVLTDRGCQSCDDECTGLLFDDLDVVKRQLFGVNVSGVVAAPWADLFLALERSNVVKKQITSWTVAVDVGESMLIDFDATFNLQGKSGQLLVKSRNSGNKSLVVAGKSLLVNEEAEVVCRAITKLATKLRDTIDRLVDYAGAVQNDSVNVDAAFLEAAKNIEEILGGDFYSDAKSGAEQEFRKAKHLLHVATKFTLDSLRRSDDLVNQLKHLDEVLTDVSRYAQNSRVNVQEAALVNKNAWTRLQDLTAVINVLGNLSRSVNADKGDGEASLSRAGEALQSSKFNTLVDVLKRLLQGSYTFDKYANTLARTLPLYETKYLDPARTHAVKLAYQAKLLNQSFSSIRTESGQALRAIRVYEDMLESISEAQHSARQAEEAAVTARLKTFPQLNSSLSSQAAASVANSRHHLNASERARGESLEALGQNFRAIGARIAATASALEECDANVRSLRDAVATMKQGQRFDIDSISNVSVGSLEALKLVDFTMRNVNGTFLPRLRTLQMASPQGMENLARKVGGVCQSIVLLTTSVSRLGADKSEDFATFNLSLERVKGLVLAAHQRVSGLTLPLGGNDGRCVRSLKPDLRPSATSTISFKFAIATNASDSFLFYLGSSKHQDKALDFMAVEMVDRRMRFAWNAGGNTVAIEHKLRLETNERNYKFNERWYRVQIHRIGNLGMLSVQRTNDTSLGADPFLVRGHSTPGLSRMDLDERSYFVFGRIPQDVKRPAELRGEAGFQGCLHDLQLDLRSVPLWNFLESSECTLCKQGPSDYEDASANEAFFNGDGYAIAALRDYYPARKDRYRFTLTFKTLDENALLLFAPNNETGFFLMVSLQDGHVVFTIGVGQENYQLRSIEKHNTATWIQVEIRKFASDAQLRIGTKTIIHSLVGADVGLKRRHDFYLGGLPPTVDVNRWDSWRNLSFVKLFGCLRGVQEDVRPVTVVDERIFGVERGCHDQIINQLSVPGKGYLELQGYALKGDSSFGFTFQSSSANGLLLMSTFAGQRARQKDKKDFFSVALENARLHLRLGSDVLGRHELVNDEALNLGSSHHVFVARNETKVDMYVNDKRVGTITLGDASSIDAPKHSGLFIGGVSEDARDVAVTSASIVGFIRDAMFDYNLLAFNRPVRFQHVGIGRTRSLTSLADPDVESPPPSMASSCRNMQVTVDELAVQFGDSPNSFVERQLALGKRTEMEVSFEFRTGYPSGLLLLLTGTKNGHAYLAVFLNNSNLVMSCTGRPRRAPSRQQSVKGRFTELTWIQVALKRKSRKVILSFPTDSQLKNRLTLNLPKNFGVTSTLYVAGMSENVKVSLAKDPAIGMPFRGCIRKFSVNRVAMDLSGGNVRQCFASVTDGSYFGGDAYAVYENSFNIGAKMDIQLEFRTTHTRGTLLSISEDSGSPALSLELDGGRVVMSVDRGAGNVLQRVAPVETEPFTSCDGKWHLVKASFNGNSISIRVDKTPNVDGHGGILSNETRTRGPLYIGGLPDFAPQGSLRSKENLIGCIRNVVINEVRQDWTDMHSRHNVLLNSCPTS